MYGAILARAAAVTVLSFVTIANVLIFELHSALLRTMACECGRHFEGLGGAALCAFKRGAIDAKMRKKLILVDSAFALVRHITRASCKEIRRDVGLAMASHRAGAILPCSAASMDVSFPQVVEHLFKCPPKLMYVVQTDLPERTDHERNR